MEKNYSSKFDDAIDFLHQNCSEALRPNVVELKKAIESVTDERDISSWVKSDIAKLSSDFSGRGMGADAIISYLFIYFQGTFRVLSLIREDDPGES